ncbi:unnamed protein product [Boreogadus saida]
MYEGLSCRYTSAYIPKAQYQWVDRISNPGTQEHLHWDCWKTTEDLVAEATSGALHNTNASLRVPKYPTLHISNRDTGERFGLQYVEPGCRPVVLNWAKHRPQHNTSAAVTVQTQLHSSAQDEVHDIVAGRLSAARTGPLKTGGLVQVLDHGRWTAPMRAATDGLLAKHHGAKGILKRVDAEYAATVQRPCTDPNSLLHPTTCQHISRYVKNLAKLKNTNSSLNTSPEKLWRPPPPEESRSRATVEKIVSEILQKQQPQQKKKVPRNSLSCGQPKSREIEAVEERSAACKKVAERTKRKSALQFPTGRLFRFCHQPLKVLSLYKDKELTWMEFQQSDFFEAERDRWVSEKRS